MNRPTPWTSSHLRSSLRLLTCSCVTAAALLGTARADDSEIYISQTDAAPNIMLILDTSGSMSGRVSTQDAYDPAVDYVAKATGNCAGISGRVYFKTGDSQGRPPACNSGDYVVTANNKCAKSTDALALAGSYQGDFFTQWRRRNSDSNSRSWRGLDGTYDTPIDCRKDPSPYPDVDATANSDTPQYTTTDRYSYWKTKSGTSATLYSPNYVAYYEQFRNAVQSTRLQVMQAAAANLLRTVSNVNVGLMRYSANTDQGNGRDDLRGNGGGIVLEPVAPIEENRDRLIKAINDFVPDGNTPLSETLYEAYRYFTGGEVYFGNTSQACLVGNSSGCTGSRVSLKSVASSRVGNVITGRNYVSPATQDCQKNYIVYLTDGEPTSDNNADSMIINNLNVGSLVGGGCLADGPGRCLGALSAYLNQTDLSTAAGTQNIVTYYIGFGSDFGASTTAFQFLADAGGRGGGDAYKAGDLSELTEVFNSIFNSISQNSSTLTAPTVAVNAFNRTRTLNDLYISIFQPTGQIHWPGNIKKYTIDPDDDATLQAAGVGGVKVDAIGTDGGFASNGSDFWSTTSNDAARVERGGAAQVIPDPANRHVYTYIGDNAGSSRGISLAGSVGTSVEDANTAIDNAKLGTSAAADADPTRKNLLDWARGTDIDDDNQDGSRTDARKQMGDPMHSQPAVLIYGGSPTAKDPDDAVVFTATNDGYVHAFSTTDGTELWSYIPQEMLPQLKTLYVNGGLATKNYSLDGDIRLLKYDTNGDGVVDPNDSDKVLLFFSTGRNPTVSRYYALDVTNKTSPKFLWSIGEDKLPDLGQAWSRPTITRVNVTDQSQNTQKLVLIFGGGYDTLEEGGAYIANADAGNSLYMVDALKGTVLWSAGDNTSTASLKLDRMKHAIPAPVNVVDLDGDGFADRMYVGDMAAQLWRFDIFNGKDSGELVTGGVIASLGAAEGNVTAANTRRFYNSPDTALLQSSDNRPYINIAIGSGYRGHPLTTNNQDRFYSIRDYQPFAMLTQTQYNASGRDIVTEDELNDITTDLSPNLPASSRGWMMQLNFPSYRGEKVLSSSTTLQNVIFFTSYTPTPNTRSNQCSPATGSNRAYAISVFDGSPLPPRASPTDPTQPYDPNDPNNPEPTREDRYNELEQTGIAPEVTTLFPEKDKVTCLSGVEVLDVCKDFNSRIKTYWRQTNAN